MDIWGIFEGSFYGIPIFFLVMLVISNIFMVFAWYAHLKFKYLKLWKVVLISWAICFVEYCFHVPANRYGFQFLDLPELKIIQEMINIVIFIVFSYAYLHERLHWRQGAGFALVILAVIIINTDISLWFNK